MLRGHNLVKHIHRDVYQIMEYLKKSMIELTVIYENKPLNFINKQFQDCIMNYFFEDFVGDIIKSQHPIKTNIGIKSSFMEDISNQLKYPPSFQQSNGSLNTITSTSLSTIQLDKTQAKPKKFMLLPQMYLIEIRRQDKEQEYVALLRHIALEPIISLPGEHKWRSQIRKKTFAVLLLVHFHNDCPLQNIFQMWESAFPGHSIKMNRKPTNLFIKKNQKTKLIAKNVETPLPSKKMQYDHYILNFSSKKSSICLDNSHSIYEEQETSSSHSSSPSETSSSHHTNPSTFIKTYKQQSNISEIVNMSYSEVDNRSINEIQSHIISKKTDIYKINWSQQSQKLNILENYTYPLFLNDKHSFNQLNQNWKEEEVDTSLEITLQSSTYIDSNEQLKEIQFPPSSYLLQPPEKNFYQCVQTHYFQL